MDHKEALHAVEAKLPKGRFDHTVRVYEEALELARRFGVNEEKAGLAAILHDYAKYVPVESLRAAIQKLELDPVVLTFNVPVWHSFAGAYIVREELGVKDADVLQAIMYHATGHRDMTDLDKVVYLADLIEPSRTFDGIEKIRELCKVDLDQAMFESVRQSLDFLIQSNTPVASYTLDVYNKYAEALERK